MPAIRHLPASALTPFADATPSPDAERLEAADRRVSWKPFTQMAGYIEGRPLVLRAGRGCWLQDVRGRSYLDGVSSLWVNLHGHGHPTVDRAVRAQLDRLDHSTLLGPTHEAAVRLAEALVARAPAGLQRVFFSDSGSSAVEIALKMAFQFWSQHRDPSSRRRDRFVAMSQAYHGDTLGSVSVGGIDLFHATYRRLLFHVDRAPAPDPYHAAFGQDPAAHEAACLRALDDVLAGTDGRLAALIIEPLMQGAAGMIRHSPAYLRGVAERVRAHGGLLIVDEVATGFGRSGTMFACEQAGVTPDLLCVAKGLSGGVLPLAATLSTGAVHDGFLGEQREARTFFHGHSFTGNPLACAAALGSLQVFDDERVLDRVGARAARLADHLDVIAGHPQVGDVRRLGLMVGIELVADRATGAPLPAEALTARRVTERALERGVLIRPLGDVVVLMPPLAISDDELDLLCGVVLQCIDEVLPG